MGCLKTIPVPACFPSLPFLCHSREGRRAMLWEISTTSRGSWSLFLRAPQRKREREMHVPCPHHPGSLSLDFCLLPWLVSWATPVPTLSSYGWFGFFFLERERGEVSISSFHCHPGPTGSSLSQVASTLGAGTAPGAQRSGKFCWWKGPLHAATALLDSGCQTRPR